MTKYIFVGIFGIAALICCSFISIDSSSSGATSNKAGDQKINWITIQELNKMAQSKDWDKKKKKIFIDLYTDWCGWCKKMDKTTFQDPRIVKYMNENYHAVKFDAETKETITFGNKQYEWVPGGRNGMNELTKALKVKGFPSYAFLDENLAKIQVISGYQQVEKLMPMLVYFNEGHHKKTPWPEFQNNFKMEDYKN